MNDQFKILLIDDQAELLEMVSFQFQARGFIVQTALNGLEGLEKLKSFHPDLIILDINMPRMGGIEFYSKICDPEGKPKYPVMVLTARSNIKELFSNLNINGFMIKPFEVDDLIAQADLIIKKDHFKEQFSQGMPRVCVVDQNQKTIEHMHRMFAKIDYAMVSASTGASGIEQMMQDTPDIALVNLGLEDLAGDIVILRLSQMAKTKKIKFILYTSHSEEHDAKIMERIRSKTGIYVFVEYKKLKEVVSAGEASLEIH